MGEQVNKAHEKLIVYYLWPYRVRARRNPFRAMRLQVRERDGEQKSDSSIAIPYIFIGLCWYFLLFNPEPFRCMCVGVCSEHRVHHVNGTCLLHTAHCV